MIKRFIAALMVASLPCSRAPAVALGTQSHTQIASGSAKPASGAQDHSCCPENDKPFLPSILPSPASVPMPCEESPCWARQAPNDAPSQSSAPRLSRTGLGTFAAIAPEPNQDARVGAAPRDFTLEPFQLASIRSTILRN